MQPNVHSFKRPELRIPGNDHSVWIDEPDEIEARPSAAIKGTRVDPTDLH